MMQVTQVPVSGRNGRTTPDHLSSIKFQYRQGSVSSAEVITPPVRKFFPQHSFESISCEPTKKVYDMNDSHVVVAMIGLPARGKTFVSKKLVRFLNWIGIKSQVFNVGNYRRKVQGVYTGNDFFRNDNAEALKIRNQCCLAAMNDMKTFFSDSKGIVAVLDATNTTLERRSLICDYCNENSYKIMFIEIICDDPNVIEANVREAKVSSPDYKGMDVDQAIKDFTKRIQHYADCYVPLSEERDGHLPFIKIIDSGSQYLVNKISGHIQSKIVYYLMNIHAMPHSIYLTRHGESIYNQQGKLGGDAKLSPNGEQFAVALAQYINEQAIPGLQVWTSHYKRTYQTARLIEAPILSWKNLNEIGIGVCEEMTYEEILEKYPKELKARDEDKYHYRYPRGESYEDLVARLEPVIMELERCSNVLVICHQGVMRCLLAYFLEKPLHELPHIRCPLHTIYKLTPMAYGCKIQEFKIDIDAVDTHRDVSKPTT